MVVQYVDVEAPCYVVTVRATGLTARSVASTTVAAAALTSVSTPVSAAVVLDCTTRGVAGVLVEVSAVLGGITVAESSAPRIRAWSIFSVQHASHRLSERR